MDFIAFIKRAEAALRVLAGKSQDASEPATPAASAEARPFRITFRNRAGELESRPATADELRRYLDSARGWRRIG
jgi:hypothetical protein